MLAILADDLTGALDTAAPFAARGMHAEVVLTVDAIEEAVQEKPAVLSINLGSRELTADAAQRVTAAALATLLFDVMQEGQERRAQLAAFQDIDEVTGPDDAIFTVPGFAGFSPSAAPQPATARTVSPFVATVTLALSPTLMPAFVRMPRSSRH